MIRINLLAQESIKREDRNEILVLGYAAVALVAVVCVLLYGLKLHSFGKAEKRLTALQQELGQYRDIVKQVETMEKTKQALVSKKTVIESLMDGRLLYPRFMEELSMLIPAGVWFKSMNTQARSGGAMTVTLDAGARDNYAIADFITALVTAPGFGGVELGAITTDTRSSAPVSSFRVTMTYGKKN